MRLVKALLATLLVMAIVMPVASCSSEKATLHIFAAAGSKAAIERVCQSYEEKYNIEVMATYGGGGEVLSMMVIDQSGDVYVAPEQSFMEKALSQGAVDANTIRSAAYMIPTIAVKKGNPKGIHSLEDLATQDIQVAIPRPETTLVGQLAEEMFEQAGISETINIVTYAPDPNQLLTMLVVGQVDAIITWHYYAYLNSDKIENVDLPPDEVTGIAEMQLAVSTYSKNPEAAKQFVDFACSAEGRDIFAQYGYIVDEKEIEPYR